MDFQNPWDVVRRHTVQFSEGLRLSQTLLSALRERKLLLDEDYMELCRSDVPRDEKMTRLLIKILPFQDPSRVDAFFDAIIVAGQEFLVRDVERKEGRRLSTLKGSGGGGASLATSSSVDRSRKPTPAELNRLAFDILSCWERVARELEPDREDVQNEIDLIRHRHRDNLYEQAVTMLDNWRSRQGSLGTVEILVEALVRSGYKDQAEKIFFSVKN